MVIDLDDIMVKSGKARIEEKKKRQWRFLFSYAIVMTIFTLAGALLAFQEVVIGLTASFIGWAFWWLFMPGYLGIKNEVL